MTNSILDSVFGTLFFLIRTQTTRTKQNKKRTFFDISVPTNPLLVPSIRIGFMETIGRDLRLGTVEQLTLSGSQL